EGGHFYLPGARSGLFNETYLKTEKPAELVITESIIDALSFMERGILNVLPIYGINGFTKAHETLLIELKPCRLIIALDGDEQGKQAAEKLKEKLNLLFNGSSIVAGNNCHTVIFPHDQDANEYFIKNSAKDFWYLTKEAGQVKQTPLHQSSFSIAHSLFKIKWAEVKGTKLNVTLKAE
ncbi:MAG: toprim domain-containing protein, partial [Lentisphaerae bacterium]|nr:toprim domain-containing protein [Lentisphaerota bacterium]